MSDSPMDNSASSTRQKALALNLDAKTYGTFAEIGAGQEVARWFFSVGGAAGTVAKTISAYDMAVSDALYGSTARYVSRQRLEAMLEHEFVNLQSGLEPVRGDAKCFFVFADTVTTGSYRHPGPGRGWLGIRFQTRPHEEPSEVIVHAHLRDSTAERQQEALGVLGVNLIHAAFYRRNDPADLIAALLDELSRERVEIDMIKFSGPAFPDIDNRLMSLQLVERGLTDAAMFTAERRGRAAVGPTSQEADPGGAGQLPAGHQAHARPAPAGARTVPPGAERARATARGPR